MSKKFISHSPETVIFLGAGATSSLMPMTGGISKFVTVITDDIKSINEKIGDEVFKNFKEEHRKAFKSLLLMLGEKDENEKNTEINKKAKEYAQKYNGNERNIKENLKKLSEIYNWQAFKAIANHTEKDENNVISIMTLYSQIDILIDNGAGFKTENRFFYPYEIIAARNCIALITTLLLFSETSKNIESGEIIAYEKLFTSLAKSMQKEAIKKENSDYENNDFIHFSYALVSFNWDSTLLGVLFNAHKEANHSIVPYLGKNVQKLRLFNDFGTLVGSLRIENKNDEPKIWYQGHESVALRLNDKDYPNRLMRVGKYVFPHSSFAFRICPVCNKTNFVFRGNTKEYLNFYGPLILPEFNDFYSKEILTEDEGNNFKDGIFDAVQCYKCDNITRMIDMPLVLQTAIKGRKPPYFEETVNEMLILIKKAKHIVFAGYSLPPDDTIYRSMIANTLAERKDDLPEITVINFEKKLQNEKYYNREDVENAIKNNVFDDWNRTIMQGFLNIFKDCKIRFSFLGVLGIFKNYSQKEIDDFLKYN